MNVKALVILLFLFPIIVFVTQNYEVVEVKFLFWSLSASRSNVLFVTFVLGVFTGCLISSLGKIKNKTERIN